MLEVVRTIVGILTRAGCPGCGIIMGYLLASRCGVQLKYQNEQRSSRLQRNLMATDMPYQAPKYVAAPDSLQ